MKPKLITSITLLMFMLTVGCGQKHPTHVAQHQPEAAQKAKPQTNKTQPAESFTDSLNIGRKGLNKVRLEQFRKEPDSTYVVIRFFSKHGDKWILKNEFHLPKDGITGPDPLISDFNNDGLKDFTFISAIAARGGNEIRTLFIYDKKNDDLVLIKNSDTFPNLSYNKDLIV
ncbi:hypothetical protein AAFN85_03625 [Mucilaginibacter sp. CAU 1740]|uniref:hypothetical protein n=1 Tax=Mucilaginibacter sp. CAU 1740 TaxID=3140365 RepID=UPI00325AC03B